MKLLMYPHGGCGNRGCEAIIETTIDMLSLKNKEAYLYSSNVEADKDVGLDKKVCIIGAKEDINIKSFYGFDRRVKAKLFHKNIDDLLLIKKYKFLKDKDIALSVGGDNYCYTGMQHVLSEQNIAIDLYKIPRVLWGCSFDETLFSDKVIKELKEYKAIFVRETLSEKILKDAGITQNVYLYPDPAFTLKSQETEFEKEKLRKGKVIGINVSPLMKRYSEGEILRENFEELISYILKETDYNIALISHVVQSGNSDYDSMKDIYKKYECDRIELVSQKYNCGQIKSLISKCDMFVGCRTHATIAAYSTCVPTLVVGYSNKSKGIAKDIFNNEDNYVIPISELKEKFELKERFLYFLSKVKDIKVYLEKIMPNYIKRSYEAGEKLKQIIKDNI